MPRLRLQGRSLSVPSFLSFASFLSLSPPPPCSINFSLPQKKERLPPATSPQTNPNRKMLYKVLLLTTAVGSSALPLPSSTATCDLSCSSGVNMGEGCYGCNGSGKSCCAGLSCNLDEPGSASYNTCEASGPKPSPVPSPPPSPPSKPVGPPTPYVPTNQPSGLAAPGPVAPIKPAVYKNNTDYPLEVLECSDSVYQFDVDGYWSWEQIARAYYQYSVKPWNFADTSATGNIGTCVAALTTVAGECNVGDVKGKEQYGCSAFDTKDSGVFQTDFLRTGESAKVINKHMIRKSVIDPTTHKQADINIMPLCTSAFGSGYMIAPFARGPPQMISGEKDVLRPGTLQSTNFNTCLGAHDTTNDYFCPDPCADAADPLVSLTPPKEGLTCANKNEAGKNVIYPNFIGPFCHKSGWGEWSFCSSAGKQGNEQEAGCCAMWNGGANNYQDLPFPTYSFKWAIDRIGGQGKLEEICTKVAAEVDA